MEASKVAQKSWAKTPLWKRAELLHKAAAILKEHKHPIAECLVKEIAKPAKDAVTEVRVTILCFIYCTMPNLGMGFRRPSLSPDPDHDKFL